MLCMNVPRKASARIQVLICVVLIVATVFCSFAPIITLKIMDKASADQVEEVVQKVANSTIEIPEKLDVSAPKLFGTVKLLTKVVKVAGEGAKSTQNGVEIQATKEELQKTLLNDDGTVREEVKDTLLIAAAVAVTFTNAMKSDKNEDGTTAGNSTFTGKILNVLVVIMALIYMLFFSLLAPVIYVIVALTAIIPAIKSMGDPTMVTAKVARKLPARVSFPMIFLLFTCVIPTMSYGIGALGIWALALICTCVNVVFSRMHAWDKKDITYANVVQGVSLVSIAGFLVYFFNVLKAGVFHSFVTGNWAGYVAKVALLTAAKKKPASNAYSIDALLIVVAVMLTLVSLSYFAKVLQRISLAVTRKKDGSARESHLVLSIVLLLIVILPKYVAGTKHCFENPETATGNAESFLILSDAQNAALNMVLVGLVIMLLSEIALLVLKKVFCKDLAREDADAILSGCAKTPEEKLAAAKEALAFAEAAAAQARAAAENAEAENQ